MIVDTGLVRILSWMRDLFNGGAPTPDLQVGLFVLPVAPDHATAWGDVTECAFGGYARQTAHLWLAPTLSVGFQGVLIESLHIFAATMAPNGNIYGWFLVDASDNTLISISLIPGGPIFTNFPLFTYTLIPSIIDLRG